MPHQLPNNFRKPALRIIGAGLFAGFLLTGSDGNTQETARPVNANWNLYLLADTIAVSPRQLTFVGIHPGDYSAAEKSAISRSTLFHLGRARYDARGTRFVLLGIPKALCRNSPGLSTLFSSPARLDIRIDGRPLGFVDLSVQCGKPALLEEVNVGSQAFSKITAAFRRGRGVIAWLTAGNRRVFGYKFSLAGFTQAASALERGQ